MIDVSDDGDVTDFHGVLNAKRRPPGVSDYSRRRDKFVKRSFRPRADMADDLGGAETADRTAFGEWQPLRQAVQEAGRIEVAGSGRIPHPSNRGGRNRVGLVARQYDAALLAARQCGNL